MVTAILLVSVVAGLIGSMALWAWFLWLGARWARISDVSFLRAVVAAVLCGFVGLAVQGAELVDPSLFDRYPLAAPLTLFASGLGLSWLLVQWILRTSFGRAILAWLPTLASQAVILAIILGIVRPFLLEAYVLPTNAMAPTLLGDHAEAVCPACGGVAIVSAGELAPEASRRKPLGICETCLHAGPVSISGEKQVGGDRIVALRVLKPRRWDVIVFEYPADPSVVYAMRLVGLPGEEVAIRDGDVWINGRREPKPEAIQGLVYTGDPLRDPEGDWGPVQLADDEFFVLGDFSLRSSDSRGWSVGAAGHSSYAVPRQNLVGVVSHIYWPLGRVRVFR